MERVSRNGTVIYNSAYEIYEFDLCLLNIRELSGINYGVNAGVVCIVFVALQHRSCLAISYY
jgi:hypothetical protein